MTTTASAATVTDEGFLPVRLAAELAGRPYRSLIRWCHQARQGRGPLKDVRVKRLGRPWGVHEADFRAYLAASVTPRPPAPTTPPSPADLFPAGSGPASEGEAR